MRKLLLILTVLLFASTAFAQYPARRVRSGTSLPPTCQAGDNAIDVYILLSGGASIEGEYYCKAGVWTKDGTGDGVTSFNTRTGAVSLSSIDVTDALTYTPIPNTRTVNGHALSSNVTVSKSDVGLGNVDNTSDTAKPVSTAQQTALNLKADLISPSFTTPSLGAASATSLVTTGGGVDIKIGGTNASYPALKRNANALDVVLADGSGYAPLNASVVSANTALTIGYSGSPSGTAQETRTNLAQWRGCDSTGAACMEIARNPSDGKYDVTFTQGDPFNGIRTNKTIEVTSGGYKFPDGTLQTTAAPTTSEQLLSTTTVSVNTDTKQALYTCPVEKTCIITKAVYRSASVDLSAGATASATMGFNAGANDFASGTAYNIPSLTAGTEYIVIMTTDVGTAQKSKAGAAGNTFGIIFDVAYGSAATMVVDLFGYTY